MILHPKESDSGRARAHEEYCELKKLVPKGQYRVFRAPFPDWMPEPGRYQNNVAVVAAFPLGRSTKVESYNIRDVLFEYHYIRDDRDCADRPETKHINVNHRLFAWAQEGMYVTGDYKAEDHLRCNSSTAIAHIEEKMKIAGLDETGDITVLRKRGLEFVIDKFLEQQP